MIRPKFVVISPVRNEGKHLPHTIQSMVAQTLRPELWVIVNDGSADDTVAQIEVAAREHSWIKILHRKDRGFRKTGGGVIEAFNEALPLMQKLSWDVIVKLDCDLSFDARYFEQLVMKFAEDARLGIASGVYLEEHSTGWEPVVMPAYHAAGACKVVRRQCFEDIGGFVQNRGWDTVDEIRAIAKGWKTGHFADLEMKHWKPEGSGIGQWRTNIMLGEIFYLTGGDEVFFVAKVLRRFLRPPFIVAGFAMLLGYIKISLRGEARLVNAEEARIYRSLLWTRTANLLKQRLKFV
jgi:poly-beta-1,6-N-acetyl-D-glucosamine synthase